ncbi:MAG: glycosyltransferase, partial [Erysipelotrichaceae bacterium]
SVVVLMSTYNGAPYLKEQMDSILTQTGDFRLDLLIRDDGSSDDTISILEQYTNTYDNVSYYRGENVGYVLSFFDLLEHAHGYDYYAFSDQDDIWMQGKIECAIQQLQQKDDCTPLLYASCSLLVDNNGVTLGKTQEQKRDITPYNAFIECFFPGHTQVLNGAMRALVLEGIDRTQVYAHDFWISTLAINFGTVVFDNNAHTLYRQHNQNVTGYSKGVLGWIKQRYFRVKDNQANLRSNQIAYFKNYYRGRLQQEVQLEMDLFFDSQTSLWKRITYMLRTKLYYQSGFKSLFYRLLYVYGGYRPSERNV